MLIGYIGVSCDDEFDSLDRQRDALISHGVRIEHIYEEKPSGRRKTQTKISACLKALKPGDTLVIWRLSCLAKNLTKVISLSRNIAVAGAGLKVLDGPAAHHDPFLNAKPEIFNVLDALSGCVFDRLSADRKKRAKTTKSKNRVGRPYLMTAEKLQKAAAEMRNPTTHVGALCKELGVSSGTLYKYIAPDGELRPGGHNLLKERSF